MEELRVKVKLLESHPYNIDGVTAEDIIWAVLGKMANSKVIFVLLNTYYAHATQVDFWRVKVKIKYSPYCQEFEILMR